jgi:hypothetical protein
MSKAAAQQVKKGGGGGGDDDDADNEGSADKYPRTPHFHFSPGVASDDIVAKTAGEFGFLAGNEIHVSEKLDGGNCCLAQGKVYARTHSKVATHESFGPVKMLYTTLIIPQLTDDEFDQLEFYGENMVQVHSIAYSDATHPFPAPFFLFAIRDRKRGVWLSVDKVAEFAERLGFCQPPTLWRGVPKDDLEVQRVIQEAMKKPSILAQSMGRADVPVEGFVARVSDEISTSHFERLVHKCVRPNHIQMEGDKEHWKRSFFL